MKYRYPYHKCAICGDYLDREHPLSISVHNPETFRPAWMHLYCYQQALEDTIGVTAGSIEYDDRFDEFVTRFGEDQS